MLWSKNMSGGLCIIKYLVDVPSWFIYLIHCYIGGRSGTILSPSAQNVIICVILISMKIEKNSYRLFQVSVMLVMWLNIYRFKDQLGTVLVHGWKTNIVRTSSLCCPTYLGSMAHRSLLKRKMLWRKCINKWVAQYNVLSYTYPLQFLS